MKNVRRMLAVLFAVLFVVTALPLTASAANGSTNLSLSLSTTKINATGETVTITLNNSAMTLSSIAGGIGFNTEEATCLSITGSRGTGTAYLVDSEGDYAAATATASVEDANTYGYASFALAGTDNVTYQAGTILTATFRIDSANGATFTLFEDSYGSDGCLIETAASQKVGILSGIAVSGPSKTEYFVGESLDTAGLTVTATYNNGTTANVTGYSVSSVDMSTAGTKTVTVTYEGKTATFNVNVTAVTVDSITVSGPSKTEYFVGESLDTAGLTVTATYNNGTSGAVTGYTLSSVDMSTAGQKTVTVTYGGQTATFTINVTAVTVDSIAVSGPSKTEYFVGESLDTAGLTVTATYNNGTTANVTGYSVSSVDMSTAGTKTVTVTYEGKRATFTINVKAITVTGITVSGPNKTVYDAGEALDTTGLTVTATYNNGTSGAVNGYTLSSVDMSTAGQKTVTVTYEGKTATFTITVNEVIVEEEFEILGLTPSASEAGVGTTITWTVETTGGEGALQYYFYAYKNGSQIKAAGWKSTNTYSLKLPSAGTYTVKAIVKDAAGNKVSLTGGQVVATSSLTVTAVKSQKTESCVLNSNTWTVTTSGGEGTLKYYYYIYKNGEQLKAAGWLSSNTYTYKFTASGTYTIKAIVQDELGNKASLTSNEIVVGPSLKIEKIETAMDTAAILDTNTWTVTASGGVGELKYYYYLYRNGEQYKMVGWKEGENANTYSPKFTASGTYYIKAVVMDEAGNKIATSGGHMVVASSLKATALESSNTEMNAGEKNTWTVTTSGGSGTLSFYYYVYKDGETYKTVGYKKGDGANALSLTLSAPGTYTVKVIAKDGNGTKATIEGGTVVVK